ncbi:MAG: Tim44 domain-containing protein [Hyphomicrobiaceae bacterium]|nr:Tim44 domain-containing protein [Hyphomicrobiaceae bacterium]
MQGGIDLTTLLFLVAAIAVFWKLRSVLGRRTGDEATRFERYKNQRATEQAQAQGSVSDKVVKLPRRDAAISQTPNQTVESDADRAIRMTKFAAGNSDLAQGLIAISKVDQAFDPAEFVKGARSAYEMIVMAFAEGNRVLLKDLLGAEVFEGFQSAITDRQSRKETIEQSFVGIKAAELHDAELKGPFAQLTIKFVSELISATRSASGEVVGGDPKRIKEMTDVWTFARDVSSSNPNWKLVATQGAA